MSGFTLFFRVGISAILLGVDARVITNKMIGEHHIITSHTDFEERGVSLRARPASSPSGLGVVLVSLLCQRGMTERCQVISFHKTIKNKTILI